MKKRILSITSAILATILLVGCSSADTSSKKDEKSSSGSSTEKVKVTIGATPTPHAEILQEAAKKLKDKNIELDIKEFSDYQLINPALTDKSLDLNYFQHQPFLDTYNKEKNDTLVSIGAVHYEPFGIYAGKTKSLADLAEGAEIGIPNDTTNGARALLLLQQEGLIKLKDGGNLDSTVLDIVENTKKFKITEIAAAQIARSLPDVDVATLNGNYALDAGFKVSQALAKEASDSIAAKTFGNIIAVRAADKDKEAFKTVVEAIKSAEVKAFIEGKYDGAVVPLF